MCDCKSCKYHCRIEEIKASGDPVALSQLVDELYEHYFMTSFDLNYENAIADGSWPQAVEILERRLDNAKKVEAKRLVDNPNA